MTLSTFYWGKVKKKFSGKIWKYWFFFPMIEKKYYDYNT